MSVPNSGASQAFPFVQYIDTLISHKGLPYQEPTKPTIRSHLSSLLQEFPCLQVKVEAFSRSDGRPSSLLLQVGGTIPIFFLQVLYNIPIVIWLSEQYPFSAPLVFVTPSPFMIIKTAHPLVDRFGLVSCTHLHSWVYPASNLVDLVRSLCIAFGQDPPLYSLNYPPYTPNGNTFMAVPSSSSSASTTLVVSTSALSLLGPGSLLQPTPLVGSARISMANSASPAQSSASLLGPGSLSLRWHSHGHAIPPTMQLLSETRQSLHQHLSHSHGSVESLPLLLSAQQHPVHFHNTGASMAQSLSTTSAGSLLGPGKTSYWLSLPNTQATPQSSGLSKRPSLLLQGPLPTAASLAHERASTSSGPTSLLGPGKSGKLFPSHEERNSSTYLPLPSSASSFSPSLSMQWHSPHSMSHVLTASTTSASASLLGTGTLSQWHPSYAQMASMALSLSTSMPGSRTSTSVDPRMQSQEHIDAHYANGRGEWLNTAVTSTSHLQSAGANPPNSTLESNSSSLLPMSHHMGSFSTSAQQCTHVPSAFSNPLLGMKDQPPDRRQELMNTLVGRLQCDIGEIRMAKEKDMLKLMDMEGLLKHRQVRLKKGVEDLQQQKENLEVQLQNILVNTDFLETWLSANDKSNVEVDVDGAFEPCDALSRQLLECTASDLAIEDALYCLDQATQKGIVPVDSYLRLVRALSREQFFHRAVAAKVRAAQGQS